MVDELNYEDMEQPHLDVPPVPHRGGDGPDIDDPSPQARKAMAEMDDEMGIPEPELPSAPTGPMVEDLTPPMQRTDTSSSVPERLNDLLMMEQAAAVAAHRNSGELDDLRTRVDGITDQIDDIGKRIEALEGPMPEQVDPARPVREVVDEFFAGEGYGPTRSIEPVEAFSPESGQAYAAPAIKAEAGQAIEAEHTRPAAPEEAAVMEARGADVPEAVPARMKEPEELRGEDIPKVEFDEPDVEDAEPDEAEPEEKKHYEMEDSEKLFTLKKALERFTDPEVIREIYHRLFPEEEEEDIDDIKSWTGFVKSHDGTQLKNYSSQITNINSISPSGVYYEYDPMTGDDQFTNSPADGKLAWKVFDYNSETGKYSLSTSTIGDIVLPVPETWEERQVLQTDTESNDGKLKFGDLTIKADKEGEETGFVFAKPDDEEDGLSQMKTLGAFISEEKQVGLLATSATSAAWGVIETDPWPKNSKITVVTGVDDEIDMTASGNTLTIRLRFFFSEIDFNAHTITEKPELYSTGTISGVTC